METIENKFNWLKTSISLKIIVIGFIILVMLIPSALIKELMWERKTRTDETIEEVTSKWGSKQEIGGLIITVPCEYYSKKDQNLKVTTEYLNILPDQLQISGEMYPETRYRGIYKVLVYKSNLHINGSFNSLEPEGAEYTDCNIRWDKAIVSAGISDPKGINENIEINWNGKNITTIPGTGICPVIGTGVHAKVSIDPKENYNFSLKLDINGSGLLSFLPLGKKTAVNIKSSWKHPQFDGAFLPDTREINDSGFIAKWLILEHNRNFPQQWFGNHNLKPSAFGVELIQQVDVYQKSMRAVKYSILFIILTYLVFFFTEIIIKKRAHPIQYIMVGAALCVFFSLLIALSEHMHFNIAYIIASSVIITLVTSFSKSVFKDINVTGIVFLVLVILFVFLFVILQLTDYSLIIGNIGLVIVLAIIMFISRKIDWYNEKSK